MLTSNRGPMASRIRSHLWLCPCWYCRRSNNIKGARALDRRRARDEINDQRNDR